MQRLGNMHQGYEIIPNFEQYLINREGKIINDVTDKVVKQHIEPTGYVRVNLLDNTNKQVKHYVHRLVAITFLQNQNNYDEIDHLDRNKQNNNVNNLRWCSRGQNLRNREKVNSDISSSEFKGVHWSKKQRKWLVHICINSKPKYCGSFSDEEDAAKVWNIEMTKHYGNDFVRNSV